MTQQIRLSPFLAGIDNVYFLSTCVPVSEHFSAVALIGVDVTTEPIKSEDGTSDEDGQAEENDTSPLLSSSSVNTSAGHC